MNNMYNMLMGRNALTSLLLAVLGLKEHEVERLRDVDSMDGGQVIQVFTRTGGGNREDYPNLKLRSAPGWKGSRDDEFDCTYAYDTFEVPAEWVEDVKALGDIFSNGLRKEFGQFLLKTLRREPDEADKGAEAYNAEADALRRLKGVKANGHTFVPYDDYSMGVALKMAEEAGGELKTCWGILPLQLKVIENEVPRPKAVSQAVSVAMTRVEIEYKWKIDRAYWQRCRTEVREVKDGAKLTWCDLYPKAMAKIQEGVDRQIEEEERKK
jgi:hypothetical protein